VDCVADLLQAEQAADPRPLVILGASMGGLLGYSAAARVGGVAHLIATCLLDPSDARTWPALSRWGGATTMRLLRPLLRRVSPRLGRLQLPLRWLVPMHRIANDPTLAGLCVSDAYGGGNRAPLGFLASYVHSTPELAPEAFHATPVTLAHPGDDRWTPAAMSIAFLERIAAPKRHVVLEGAGHFPVEEPGLAQLVGVLETVHAQVARGTSSAAIAL
jgi:alpha-beta hydrolase superfamily lysophospholipase